MATEPHSGPSPGAAGATTDTHIAPWASRWSVPPEPQQAPVASSSPTVPKEAAKSAPIAPVVKHPVPSLFAARLMAGISALAFGLLALLVVICWPDISRLLG